MSTLSKQNKSQITGEGYEFVEKGHSHYFNGQRMTGITTVLSVISKGDALIQWAANMAVDYIDGNLPVRREENILSVDADDFKRILEEARKAHCRKKEEAGQKGTDIHALISEMIKSVIGAVEYKFEKSENPQIQHFIEWTQNNKVKFLESEKHLYSKTHFLGGICDGVVEIDGQKWLIDFKTGGTRVYAEAFFQMGGYEILLSEMGEYKDLTGYIVLGIFKEGTMEEKRSVSNEDNKQAFLNALSLYRIVAKVN